MRAKTERNEEVALRARCGEPHISIARTLGMTRQRVQQVAKAAGVDGHGPAAGMRHPSWRGGRIRTTVGYTLRLAPEHPRANTAGYVLEHVLVAEQKLGRAICSSEHVHHINGDRSDNRPENLEVLTASEHMRLHGLRFDRDLLIAWLQWYALRLGHTPRVRDLQPPDFPTWFIAYYARFGSLTKAAVEAGLTPNGRGHPGHGGTPLPPNFRRRHAHLLKYRTAEELADDLFGGVLTEHERRLSVA